MTSFIQKFPSLPTKPQPHHSKKKPSPLPPSTRTTIAHLLDALLKPPPSHPDLIISSGLPGVINKIIEALNTKLTGADRDELGALFKLLDSAVGCTLLSGFVTTAGFNGMTPENRERMLQSLKNSVIGAKRKIFNTLKRLILGICMSYSQYDTYIDTLNGIDERLSAGGDAASSVNPMFGSNGYLPYPGPPLVSGEGVHSKYTPTHDYQSNFITLPELSNHTFDYVVLGSGCGGGVAAATLTKAGFKVLVVEKNKYIPPEELTQVESEGMGELYEKSGLLTSSDGNVMILAGSGFGGGSRVNWACCLDTPDYVRSEWCSSGLNENFKPSGDFDVALASVKERLGVSVDNMKHNGMNRILIEGCEKMDYKYKVAPQNFKNTSDSSAGYTCFGDRQGNKQSGVETYLLDASSSSLCKFIHASAFQILHKNNKAIGVTLFDSSVKEPTKEGTKMFTVNCPNVIASCGSLHTPTLLLRSGFQNKHIGKNLRLHPCTSVVAMYAETGSINSEVNGFLGAPMTTVVSEFQMGPLKDGFGSKLECPSTHTGVMAAALPWRSSKDFSSWIYNCANLTSILVLQRDKTGGSVKLAPDGFNPVVDYFVGKDDANAIVEGAVGAFNLLLSTDGVKTIGTMHQSMIPYTVKPGGHKSSENVEGAKAFVKEVRKQGVEANTFGLFSAHQMGTARMSPTAEGGVVDESGEMWECDGVHIIDASVFPSASGSNPMLSVLTISKMVSDRLVARAKSAGSVAGHDERVKRRKEQKGKGLKGYGFFG